MQIIITGSAVESKTAVCCESSRWFRDMGSLPNLHELSREKLSSPIHRPAPVGGLGPVRLPPQPPPLAHTHKRVRSSGSHHHHHAAQLWDNDAMFEVFIYTILHASLCFIVDVDPYFLFFSELASSEIHSGICIGLFNFWFVDIHFERIKKYRFTLLTMRSYGT